MANPAAPDRHHEHDSTLRPATRHPAPVSAARDVDRGTRLGVGTRILTAVVAAPLRIVRACAAVGRSVGIVLSRVARRCTQVITRCARSLRTVLERCLLVAAWPVGVLRRCIHVVFLGLGRFARMLASGAHSLAVAMGALLRPVGHTMTRCLAAIVRLLRQAVETVVEPIARRLRALSAALAHRAGALLRWVAHALAPFWQTTARLLNRLLRTSARLLGKGVTSCGRGARSVAARFARVGRWIGERTGAHAVRVLYGINVAIARARAQHTLGIDDAIGVEDPPAMPAGDCSVPCTIEVFQNPYLPRRGTTVDVIVTVSTAGLGAAARDVAPERAEVILVDCSGSMGKPWRKIRSVRMATAAAIEALPEGTWFAIVRANHDAQVVYPLHGGLVRKTPETTTAVHRALRLLWPEGGTAMGRWLVAARELFALRPGAIAHAILLTDGHNEGEAPDDLAMAVERCVGSFQCDCRGVGDDWDVEELRRISSALLGTVDIVREPEQLAAEFTAMTELAMGRSVNDVRLRVWTPRGAEVVFLRQVAPGLEDLTHRRTDLDEVDGEYPTGAWGEETRDYHLRIRVPAREIGERMLAGRSVLMVNGTAAAEGKILAEWTDDEDLSTRLHPDVAHVTGQADLASAIHRGLEALRARDTEGATHHLGHAVKLAHETGDTVRLDQLRTIVDVDDAVTGTVHVRDDARRIDIMTLDTSSTKTVRRT